MTYPNTSQLMKINLLLFALTFPASLNGASLGNNGVSSLSDYTEENIVSMKNKLVEERLKKDQEYGKLVKEREKVLRLLRNVRFESNAQLQESTRKALQTRLKEIDDAIEKKREAVRKVIPWSEVCKYSGQNRNFSATQVFQFVEKLQEEKKIEVNELREKVETFLNDDREMDEETALYEERVRSKALSDAGNYALFSSAFVVGGLVTGSAAYALGLAGLSSLGRWGYRKWQGSAGISKKKEADEDDKKEEIDEE